MFFVNHYYDWCRYGVCMRKFLKILQQKKINWKNQKKEWRKKCGQLINTFGKKNEMVKKFSFRQKSIEREKPNRDLYLKNLFDFLKKMNFFS